MKKGTTSCWELLQLTLSNNMKRSLISGERLGTALPLQQSENLASFDKVSKVCKDSASTFFSSTARSDRLSLGSFLVDTLSWNIA